MFLAKKRIAIAREDGYKEGYKEGLEEVRKERAKKKAELEAKIAELTAINKQLREKLRLLRAARYTTTPSP